MNKSTEIAERMREKLAAAFGTDGISIEDDSARHAGHAGAKPGGETHFTVRIVSDSFAGLSRIERQRRVYAVLAEELRTRVHALQLDTRTPNEMTQTKPMR